MKTKLQIFKILVLLPILALQISCSKKKNGAAGTVAVTGYHYNNGICYNNANQQVATNLCGNVGGYGGNGGYYMNNGQCYSVQNQVVAMTYCQSGAGGYGGGGFGYPNGGGFPNGGGAGQCVGFYYWTTGYGYQSVYCSGFDCSGYMLTNSMGQPVFCQ